MSPRHRLFRSFRAVHGPSHSWATWAGPAGRDWPTGTEDGGRRRRSLCRSGRAAGAGGLAAAKRVTHQHPIKGADTAQPQNGCREIASDGGDALPAWLLGPAVSQHPAGHIAMPQVGRHPPHRRRSNGQPSTSGRRKAPAREVSHPRHIADLQIGFHIDGGFRRALRGFRYPGGAGAQPIAPRPDPRLGTSRPRVGSTDFFCPSPRTAPALPEGRVVVRAWVSGHRLSRACRNRPLSRGTSACPGGSDVRTRRFGP